MSSSKILGYNLGSIAATSAFTSSFTMNADGPLQYMINELDFDRQVMDKQPGMYIKYVPARFDPLNRDLLTGGAYLFSTRDTATQYVDWMNKVYEGSTPGIKFWDRPIFKNVQRWIWDVIGAHNFNPVEQHALSRVQRFAYKGDPAVTDKVLKELYPRLRDTAEVNGAAAFWLLHHPDEKLISTHLIAGKKAESDPLTAAREAVAWLEALPSHVAELPFETVEEFDRTSLFIQNWLPVSRVAGGAHQATPNFPVLPQVTEE